MALVTLGINHRTAPVELRERVAFTPERMAEAFAELRATSGATEAAILSTCNRTELYLAGDDDCAPMVLRWMAGFHGMDAAELEEALYVHRDGDAVRHMMRVAAGLDSMVLGEPQILGQLKDAYSLAREHGASGSFLSRLFEHTFSVAKRVRTQTAIGENPVSVAYAAVSMAHHIFADMSRNKALLIGAGKTIELVARHLADAGVKDFLVANRTLERAQALAESRGGKGIVLSEIPEHLADVDIIISSTASPLPILGKGAVERALKKRKHRPYFMVDIAVPRDIDPRINKISNAYVYDIDDLKNIVETNIQQREHETVKARRFVEEAVVVFRQWLDSLAIVPTIKAINDKMTSIVDIELEKTLGSLSHLSESDAAAIRRMTRAIASRAIHDPILFLRNTGDHRDDSLYLNVARQLFNLDIPDQN